MTANNPPERYLDPKHFKSDKPSPYRLFEMSGGNPDEYKRLMIENGYLIEKKVEEPDRNCDKDWVAEIC